VRKPRVTELLVVWLLLALCCVASDKFSVSSLGELQLAFLRLGDVWITNVPDIAPIRFTASGDVLAFTWLPDGTGIVTFDGDSICYMNYPADGTASKCIDLNLSERFTQGTGIVVSPNQHSVVIWNREGRWGEQTIGWLIVGPDGEVVPVIHPEEMGVDFGGRWEELPPELMENHPEVARGRVEPPMFLDGTLIGAFTSRFYCGSGGCSYVLHEFDFASARFHPYDLDHYHLFPWTCSGVGLDFSRSEYILTSFGYWKAGLEEYGTCYSILDLSAQTVRQLEFPQETLLEQSLSSDATRAVVSRADGRPFTGSELCDMQVLDLHIGAEDVRVDLLPGRYPEWSTNDDYIAFQACLVKESSEWHVNTSAPISVYVGMLRENGFQVELVSEGVQPHWRP
jgi:hypothetical protein